jgi:anti-sigma-K factor RskA
MPPPPVDDHTEEFEQLAALSALDVLEGDERDRFEQHAEHCERCRVMVRLDREALARAAPEMDPSPDFKARLMQRAAAELDAGETLARPADQAAANAALPQEQAPPAPPAQTPLSPEAPPQEQAPAPPAQTPLSPKAQPQEEAPAPPAQTPLSPKAQPQEEAPARPAQTPLSPKAPPQEEAPTPPEPTPLRPEAPPPNVIPLWRRAPRWASALAAVLVLGIVALGGYSYQNQIVASYPLSGSVPGSATVNVRRSGAAELQMRGVASPPPGYLYEAWIIPPGSAPIAAGTAPSGDATLPLNDLGSGATVAITQERSRVDAPTSAPVLAAQL